MHQLLGSEISETYGNSLKIEQTVIKVFAFGKRQSEKTNDTIEFVFAV